MRKKLIYIVCILSFFFISQSIFPSYPRKLKKINLSDKTGLVIDRKKIKIENVDNPINLSIIEDNDAFLAVFRVNDKDTSNIGICKFDKEFNQISKHKIIDVKSKNAEDPRIFKIKNEYYIIYNDKVLIEHNYRIMKIAKLTKDFDAEFITSLDLYINTMEKNWVPFEDNGNLYLAYGLVPHKIMHLKDTKKNSLDHLIFEDGKCYSRFFWEYGDPRGGTPACKTKDGYLAFFHSSFGKNKKKKYYVMGAYLFEPNPPYKVVKVSKEPIIVYPKKTRVYFPTGFSIKKEDNIEKIYLSLGINDTVSEVLVIDKDNLLKSMKEVY